MTVKEFDIQVALGSMEVAVRGVTLTSFALDNYDGTGGYDEMPETGIPARYAVKGLTFGDVTLRTEDYPWINSILNSIPIEDDDYDLFPSSMNFSAIWWRAKLIEKGILTE